MARLRTRSILILLIAAIAGSAATWLAISIPRDLQAEALLRDGRNQLKEPDGRQAARETFLRVVQEYPRTDAAAAANAAVMRLLAEDLAGLRREIEKNHSSGSETIRRAERQQSDVARRVGSLDERIGTIEEKITDLEAKVKKATAPPPKQPARRSGTRRNR